MLKKLLGMKIGLAPLRSSFPASGELDSSQFHDSGKKPLTLTEVLQTSGRPICMVLSQVLKRSGYQPTAFRPAVEFDNQSVPSFRLRIDMKADAALEQIRCKEIETTVKIELEIRYEIHVSTIYWRIEDVDAQSLLLAGIGQASQSAQVMFATAGSNGHSKVKKPYPSPVRVLIPPSEDPVLVVTGEDREATQSEIDEFKTLEKASLTKET